MVESINELNDKKIKSIKSTKKSVFKKSKASGNIYDIHGAHYKSQSEISLSFVRHAINNPYLREQVINLMPQIFSGQPDVVVHKKGILDPDEELSKKYNYLFIDLNTYQSMQITFKDILYFGASVKSIGYDENGTIIEIRDLPATTFNQPLYKAKNKSKYLYSPNPLMQGINVYDDGEIIVAQTDQITLEQEILENVDVIIAPTAPKPAGEAYCMPIYPIIAQIDIVTDALNRKIDRIGVPVIFPQVKENAVEDQEVLNKWAEDFLKHWGNDTGYLLPQSIDLANVNIYESTGGEERLQVLADIIAKFFNPTTTFDKDGQSVIAVSETGKTSVWHAYITSHQEWIESEYEKYFNEMLKYEGYDDYECEITIPRPAVDQTDVKMQQLQLAIQSNLITKSEARELLDTLNLPPMTEEIKKELESNNNDNLENEYFNNPNNSNNTNNNTTNNTTNNTNNNDLNIKENNNDNNDNDDDESKDKKYTIANIFNNDFKDLTDSENSEKTNIFLKDDNKLVSDPEPVVKTMTDISKWVKDAINKILNDEFNNEEPKLNIEY